MQIIYRSLHKSNTWQKNGNHLTQRNQNICVKKHVERTERSDYLRFQLDELTNFKLRQGEWETLETEHHRLTHAEELLRNIAARSATYCR